ncbi:MAG: chemotaxis protein CheW [Spirochaetaceae bacterium]|nr:chemotaxis protein CheW [Spirochaetaceae bacterium]
MSETSSGRYLSFELGGEQYAIEVERVEVVLETVPITRVPKAPSHLRGVINYRGSVIPVADLRSRFGEGAEAKSPRRGASAPAPAAGAPAGVPEATADSEAPGAGNPSAALPPAPGAEALVGGADGASIIVLQINYAGDPLTIGVLADAVREVVDLDPSRIERAPRFGGRRQDGLISGIGEKDGRFIVLLDVDAAFAAEAEAARERRGPVVESPRSSGEAR